MEVHETLGRRARTFAWPNKRLIVTTTNCKGTFALCIDLCVCVMKFLSFDVRDMNSLYWLIYVWCILICRLLMRR